MTFTPSNMKFVTEFLGTGIAKCDQGRYLQEVFYVYLNKFENAVSHLFLIIFGNTCISVIIVAY